MALFKISKGTASNLLTSNSSKYAREGSAWFTTDDGKFYIDIAGNGTSTFATIGGNRIPLNAAYADQLYNPLTIKFNNGYTEDTDHFNFDGSSPKEINITPALVGAVSKTGDTMTGDLILSTSGSGDSPSILFVRGTATDSYDDIKIIDSAGKLVIAHRSGNNTWNNLFSFDISANETTQNLIPSTNGTLSLGGSDHKWGTVYANTFSGNATSADQVNNTLVIQLNGGTTESNPTNTATDTKITFDGSVQKTLNVTAGKIGALPITGGTMTGDIVLANDPTANMHPVTKQYFENHASSVTIRRWEASA